MTTLSHLEKPPANALLETNNQHFLKMIFLFPRWDILVPGRVFHTTVPPSTCQPSSVPPNCIHSRISQKFLCRRGMKHSRHLTNPSSSSSLHIHRRVDRYLIYFCLPGSNIFQRELEDQGMLAGLNRNQTCVLWLKLLRGLKIRQNQYSISNISKNKQSNRIRLLNIKYRKG